MTPVYIALRNGEKKYIYKKKFYFYDVRRQKEGQTHLVLLIEGGYGKEEDVS